MNTIIKFFIKFLSMAILCIGTVTANIPPHAYMGDATQKKTLAQTDEIHQDEHDITLSKEETVKKLELEMLRSLYQELKNRKKNKEEAQKVQAKAQEKDQEKTGKTALVFDRTLIENIDWNKIGNNIVKNSRHLAENLLMHNIALSMTLYVANMTIPGKPLGNLSYFDFFCLKYLSSPVPAVQIVEPSYLYRLYSVAFRAVFGY